VSGTCAGQVRTISDYVADTNIATVSAAWTTNNPSTDSVYVVVVGADANDGKSSVSAPFTGKTLNYLSGVYTIVDAGVAASVAPGDVLYLTSATAEAQAGYWTISTEVGSIVTLTLYGGSTWVEDTRTDVASASAPVATIQKAVDLAKGTTSTINVAAGTYAETAWNYLYLYNATYASSVLTIVGASNTTTLMTGSRVVRFAADARLCTVAFQNMGFTLAGTDAQVYNVEDGNTVSFTGCAINQTGNAIFYNALTDAESAAVFSMDDCVVTRAAGVSNAFVSTTVPMKSISFTDTSITGGTGILISVGASGQITDFIRASGLTF
jgi:hypothetical protein